MGFWLMFFISLAFTVAGELLRPKQKFDDAKPSAIGDFQFPTADAARCIQWWWGTCKISGPNTTWFGDYTMYPILKTVSTGWFSEDTFIQGYQHHLGAQLVFGWGVVDEIIDFIADDKPVKYTVTEETADYKLITMNDPTFISADEPFNGLGGKVRIYKGTTSQVKNDYLQTQWADTDPNIPAFRRLCYAVLEKCWIGNTETPPPFGIVARRTPNQLGLTGGKHNVNGDANIAAACYEIMTDVIKGLKISPLKINAASFIACGNTLHAEGLGISMMADTPRPGKDWLSDMLRHADGVIYPDPVTGLYTMALARKDYTFETLPIFDDSCVATEDFDFTRQSWEETKNVITVNFCCRAENYQTRPATYRDLANIDVRNGTISAETIDFLGFSNFDQAMHAAERAGKTHSSPTAKSTFTANRKGGTLRPGSVFRLTKEKYKIKDLVMRVISINYGTLDDPRIRVTCVEDIFAINARAYSTPTGSNWSPPTSSTLASLLRSAFEEAPYEMLGVQQRGVMALGSRNDNTSVTGFEVWSDPTGGTAYAKTNTSRGVIASGTLNSNYSVGLMDDPTGFVVANVEDPFLLSSITSAQRADGVNIVKIGNEYMAWQDVSVAGSTVTISKVLRGVFDTLPEPHLAGDTVWFLNRSIPLTALAPYTADVTVKGKLLAMDRTRVQTLADVPGVLTITTAGRTTRPNPPGRVRVNGIVPPATVSGAFDVTWEHRNRLNKKAVSQDATSIASEPNVSYTVEVRNSTTNALIVSKTSLAGPSATLSLVTGTVKVLIYAVLPGGVRSRIAQSFVTGVTSTFTTNTITGVLASGGDSGDVVIIDGGKPSDPPPPTTEPPPTEEPEPPGGTGGTPSGSLPTLDIGVTVVSVATYGAVGNGTTDDSAAVQAAINALPASGGTVQGVAGKTYLLDPAYQDCNSVDTDRCGVKMKSKVFLDFSMCAVKLKVTNSDHYYGVYCYNINNFKIVINRITGYRYDPAFLGTTTTTREWGHNIAVYGCDLWIIQNTTTEKASGDCIGIGGRSTANPATNGYIDNVVCSEGRRQGTSVGHCNNIRFSNCKFIRTKGTNPASGVDLEMDNHDNPLSPYVENVWFDNCDFDDNHGPGLQTYFHVRNVTINNCRFRRTYSSYGGIYFYDASFVTITASTIRDNNGWGFQCRLSDNINVSGCTFMNNRINSRGNHPTGPTVVFTGTGNAEFGHHAYINGTNPNVVFGSNTWGPTDA